MQTNLAAPWLRWKTVSCLKVIRILGGWWYDIFLKYGFTLEIWGQKERYVDICDMLAFPVGSYKNSFFFHISWVETTKTLGYAICFQMFSHLMAEIPAPVAKLLGTRLYTSQVVVWDFWTINSRSSCLCFFFQLALHVLWHIRALWHSMVPSRHRTGWSVGRWISIPSLVVRKMLFRIRWLDRENKWLGLLRNWPDFLLCSSILLLLVIGITFIFRKLVYLANQLGMAIL